MKAAVLLLAAGEGTRLGSNVPKAFVEVAGRPLLWYAVRAFASLGDALVIAAPRGHDEIARGIAETSGSPIAVVEGGATRGESVRRALVSVPDAYREILCHDVARPFPAESLIARVRAGLTEADAVVPVVSVTDTVKRVRDGLVVETMPREDLVLVQTPQAFRRDVLERAHREAEAAGIEATDDAALVERLGRRVVVVPGDPENIKVTVASDLWVAEAIAKRRDG